MLLIALAAVAGSVATRPCASRDLVLSTDARDGDFDGMSQSGTYLIVRNRGTHACSLPGLPAVFFYDNRGRSIGAVRQSPRGMHPGPVVRPVTIRAGGNTATALRWVSGPVYDRNRTFPVEAVGMTIDGRTLRTKLRATLVGQVGQPMTFSQSPLAPLPPAD